MRKSLLFPLAVLFGACVSLRNWLYDKQLLPIRRLNRPVISVGNLAMGGSGKTPIVDALVKQLTHRGHRVAVLSRGYGRRQSRRVMRVDPSGPWDAFGDEPTMLARRNPDACVCVGGNRVAASALAQGFDPTIYVLDDGFQHRAVRRDLDLVVIDGSQPPPRLFPLGLFREGWRSLKRADAVILSRHRAARDPASFLAEIRQVNAHLPVIGCNMSASELVVPAIDKSIPLTELAGERVGAFAGIAYPDKFFNLIQDVNAQIVVQRTLKDHEPLHTAGLRGLLADCRDNRAKWLVTTEKDWVKLEVLPKSDILIGFIPLEIQWVDPEKLDRILDDLCNTGMPYDQETTGPT